MSEESSRRNSTVGSEKIEKEVATEKRKSGKVTKVSSLKKQNRKSNEGENFSARIDVKIGGLICCI